MNDSTSPQPHKTQWGPIFTDMIILMCVMSAIGYLCNLMMKPFESVTPVDSLISLIRKGDLREDKDGKLADAPFLKELQAVLNNKETAPQGVNTADHNGRTPLMWAVYTNFNNPDETIKKDVERLYYVRALLAVPGIDIHAKDEDGFTALHWAAWSGMPYSAMELARAGLDVNETEANGYTPLMLAALRGNAETVETLLALGAKPDISRANGSTALTIGADSENSYDKSRNWKYKLIYSEAREASYAKAMELLKGKAPIRSVAQLEQDMQAALVQMNEKAATQSAADQEAAAEKAEETRMEQQIEKAAGAPANTSPDQDPSAQMD